MARPEIRPAIFLDLQNALAALLFAALLGAEIIRRGLDAHPGSELLWRLSGLANRTVMPVLRIAEEFFATPERLVIALVAAIAVVLLAWWTRYWFASAVAGHVTLAALVIVTLSSFNRGSMALASLDLDGVLAATRHGPAFSLLVAACLFLLVMCIADHVAFLRFLFTLRRRKRKTA